MGLLHPVTVVCDEKLALASSLANGDPHLPSSEVVRVLDDLDEPVKRLTLSCSALACRSSERFLQRAWGSALKRLQLKKCRGRELLRQRIGGVGVTNTHAPQRPRCLAPEFRVSRGEFAARPFGRGLTAIMT